MLAHMLIINSVIALSKLYSLNDSRISQIMVKGDLIVAQDDGRIKTRSRAKQSKFLVAQRLSVVY
jgi:hypothetical protein